MSRMKTNTTNGNLQKKMDEMQILKTKSYRITFTRNGYKNM